MNRPPIAQTSAAIIGVAILIALGSWQMQRLEWKEGMIAALEKDYEDLESGRVSFVSPERLSALSAQDQPIAVGKLRGSFLREDAILVGPKPDDGRIGYELLIPLTFDDGHTIIVNTGWVDAIWKDDLQSRLVLLPQDSVTVTGILRKPDWNRFTSKNSPANDLWFRADAEEIAEAKNLNNAYPFLIYATGINPPLHDVKPIEERWLPRNKHLQYALFWFSMAATLVAVYGFYWRSRRK